MKNIIVTFVAIIVIALLAGAGFIYSGTYNVAATSKDGPLMSWVLITTRERSIEHRANNIIAPGDNVLNNPETIRAGFEHYNEMCVVCHGAPGVEAGEARAGLNPKPPLLAKLKDLKDDPLGEVFWIIKNGIKMTAMPAWGPTHSDDKIWAMVSFVRKLPDMSAEEYKAMQQQSAESGHMHEHGEPMEMSTDHDHDEAQPHEHTH